MFLSVYTGMCRFSTFSQLLGSSIVIGIWFDRLYEQSENFQFYVKYSHFRVCSWSVNSKANALCGIFVIWSQVSGESLPLSQKGKVFSWLYKWMNGRHQKALRGERCVRLTNIPVLGCWFLRANWLEQTQKTNKNPCKKNRTLEAEHQCSLLPISQ